MTLILILEVKWRYRIIKGAVVSFLWSVIWFVGHVTVSSLRSEYINLISYRNLGHLKGFQVAQRCRNYCFEEQIEKLISIGIVKDIGI